VKGRDNIRFVAKGEGQLVNLAEERHNHVHLLFGLSDAGSMKVALSAIGRRLQSRIIAFNDLFSIGPLWHLEEEAGQRRRHGWMTKLFYRYLESHNMNKEHQIDSMIDTLAHIPERNKVTIWCSDNAHDQVGLRFALYLLQRWRQPVYVVNVTQAYAKIAERFDPKINPIAQGQVPFEALQEILLLTDDNIPLAEEERRRYVQEWQELSDREDTLRLWQGGKIISVPEDYYDEALITIVGKLQRSEGSNGFVRAGHVVDEAIDSWNQLIGDFFVEYRLRALIRNGWLEIIGLPGVMHRYSVRLRNLA
jgi:hypothetical protein